MTTIQDGRVAERTFNAYVFRIGMPAMIKLLVRLQETCEGGHITTECGSEGWEVICAANVDTSAIKLTKTEKLISAHGIRFREQRQHQ